MPTQQIFVDAKEHQKEEVVGIYILLPRKQDKMDRSRLLVNSAGETWSFDEYADTEDIHIDLLAAFPELCGGGGCV